MAANARTTKTKQKIRKGTFFLGGEGGGAGEFWYFFPKKCWPSTFRWLTKVRPSPHYYMVYMFHAVETSERFACKRKVFEYEYISILNVCALKQGKCEQSVWEIYLRFRAEVWIWKYLSIIKVLNIKYLREKYTRFFLRLASIAAGYFNRKVLLFV